MCRLSRLVLVLALSVCTTGTAAETHPFDVHDLIAMERVSDPQPSPDGSVAAFVVKPVYGRFGTNVHRFPGGLGPDTRLPDLRDRPWMAPVGGHPTVESALKNRTGSSDIWRGR